jgi:hypothetical protein
MLTIPKQKFSLTGRKLLVAITKSKPEIKNPSIFPQKICFLSNIDGYAAGTV